MPCGCITNSSSLGHQLATLNPEMELSYEARSHQRTQPLMPAGFLTCHGPGSLGSQVQDPSSYALGTILRVVLLARTVHALGNCCYRTGRKTKLFLLV